jgi:hypothetical protein
MTSLVLGSPLAFFPGARFTNPFADSLKLQAYCLRSGGLIA